jgi:hypothetical protein
MAQSNYNIPNDSAPAVRAQLNSVFQSIASNNSGTSAPATTFPHQWWYDSTTNILKQRNAADSAWIDIGTFDQTGGTFSPFGVAQLTQTQAEDPASTVFGTVSGQRLEQQTNAAFNVTGSAPKYACRAWVNFNGTGTVAIRESGNVSSITDNGTGDYTVNFTTAMPDANYIMVGSGQFNATDSNIQVNPLGDAATGSRRIRVANSSAAVPVDCETVNVSVFR